MADASIQPRRSSRSTKGQHRQVEAEAEEEKIVAKQAKQANPRKRDSKAAAKGKSKKSKANKEQDSGDEDEDGSRVRCVCGVTEADEDDDDDDKSLMAQCEQCLCWQHTKCTMGITDEADVPEKYYCEQCRPEMHEKYFKELAAKTGTNTGENQTSVMDPTGEQEDKSEVAGSKVITNENRETATTDDVDEVESSEGNLSSRRSVSFKRRNTDRTTASPPEPNSKKLKTNQEESSPSEKHRLSVSKSATRRSSSGTQPALPRRKSSASTKAGGPAPKTDHIADIADNVRKSVANALLGLLQKAIDDAVADSSFTLKDSTSAELAESLALNIEYALYEQLAVKTEKDVGHKYRDKFRTILFNLKDAKNSILRHRVISGEITPDHVAKMTAEEMMNPELQKLAEAVRAESISQSILTKTEAPRIRRTHKGEEFVGDVDQMITFPENAPESHDESGKNSANVLSPEDAAHNPVSPYSAAGERHFTSDFANPDDPANTSGTVENRNEANRTSFGDYSRGDDYYSEDDAVVPDEIYTSQPVSPPPQSMQRQVADEDIDRLLNDDYNPVQEHEDDFDNSYSPTLAATDPVVWSGLISMASVAEFPAKAYQVGGPLFDGRARKWDGTIASTVHIDGRLAMDTAGKYLLEVAATKDLVAVSFTASDLNSKDQQREFTRLFDYFRSRNRYGVIRNRFTSVKDAYLVPLLPADPRPDFMAVMESVSIPSTITAPLLLGIFVVNKVTAATVRGIDASAGDSFVGYNYSPPFVSRASFSPTPETAPAAHSIVDALNALSLPQKDVAVLQSILASRPDVIANPSLVSDPHYMIKVVQEYMMSQS